MADVHEEEEEKSSDQLTPQVRRETEESVVYRLQFDLIEEIFFRLPVKTLLQLRCVSKPWLSLISEPSFVKRYNTRSTRVSLFIVAEELFTSDQHILFADHNGRSITHLVSLPNCSEFSRFDWHPQNVNGLLLFTPASGRYGEKCLTFVVNPTTRKIFKLPNEAYDPRGKTRSLYLLGFDKSSREHKALNIKAIDANSGLHFKATEFEFKVFCLSNYSLRKINVEFPFDPNEVDWQSLDKRSVCLNNVIHFLLHNKRKILGFDLQTEKFSVMNLPPVDQPSLTTIYGLLGVCHREYVVNHYEMEVWILKDYKNQVWVKDQSFSLPDTPISECGWPHLSEANENIMFNLEILSPDVLGMQIYNMEEKTYRSIEVNLSHEVLCSKIICVNGVGSYVESIASLKNSTELLPLLSCKGGETKCATNSTKSSSARTL